MGKYFTQTFYEKNNQPGELWVRDVNNNVKPVSEFLSNVITKYKPLSSNYISSNNYTNINTDFYNSLIDSKNILRFDIMDDVLFLETSVGNIFEQITTSSSGAIIPKNQNNNFSSSENLTKRFGFPDYWYDESNRNIFIASNKIDSYSNFIKIGYIIEVFDIKNSILDIKYHFNIKINFGNDYVYKDFPVMEPVKLTYNKSTKTFNLSHILRGANKEFGLISINVIKDQNLNINKYNALLPFKNPLNIEYEIVSQKKLSISSDVS